ncbi:MAG: hypothetical protein ACH36H_07450 [Candidatus Nanopelagicales bacterium]
MMGGTLTASSRPGQGSEFAALDPFHGRDRRAGVEHGGRRAARGRPQAVRRLDTAGGGV